MTGWWHTRSPREKLLLMIAGSILAIALIWQLVVRPSVYTLDRAKLKHEASVQTLARLDRIESLKQQGEVILPIIETQTGLDSNALLSQAERMASESGLLISASETVSPTSFKITLSAVAAPAYFQWVEQVETGLGVSTHTASLTQNADGSMDADTEFSVDGAP